MKTFTSKDYSLLGYNLAVNPYNWLVVMNQYTVAFSVMPLHSLFGSDPEKVVCARQRIQTLDFISLGSESLPGSSCLAQDLIQTSKLGVISCYIAAQFNSILLHNEHENICIFIFIC